LVASRRCLYVTIENRVRNETLREETVVNSTVVKNLGNKTLRWTGHAEGMEDEGSPQNLSHWS
jgi:hypothetical protein